MTSKGKHILGDVPGIALCGAKTKSRSSTHAACRDCIRLLGEALAKANPNLAEPTHYAGPLHQDTPACLAPIYADKTLITSVLTDVTCLACMARAHLATTPRPNATDVVDGKGIVLATFPTRELAHAVTRAREHTLNHTPLAYQPPALVLDNFLAALARVLRGETLP